MHNLLKLGAATVLIGIVTATAHVANAQAPKSSHVLMNSAELKWGPAPPALPPGGQVAIVEGDPAKAGEPFVMAAKIPNGYTVPPHWHPTDENLVIISGALMLGMGDKLDKAAMKTVSPGGFAKMPANMRHSAVAKGETVFYVYGVGPFELTYVNPNDDPRKKTTSQ